MLRKIFKYTVLLSICIFWAVYAIDTIRVTLPNTSLTWETYSTQTLQILDDELFLINRDNDTSFIGDFFTWYYHDSAHWRFSMDDLGSNGVEITSTSVTDCSDNSTHSWYKLSGFSYNPEFWAMNFDHDSSTYVFICITNDENSWEATYIWWTAYSELIWSQNFNTVPFDAYVDRTADHNSSGRYVKVDGVISSNSFTEIDVTLSEENRVLWSVEKSSLRRDLLQNVYTVIRNQTSSNGSRVVNSLWSSTWTNSWWWELLLENSILYFWDLAGAEVRLNGDDDIQWIKTLIIEWWNLRIMWNIRNTWNQEEDTLWIIVIEKDKQWWNILIESSVTDIHATLYTDRSLVSSIWGVQADGDTPDSSLANQLYIYGSLFSENTIWGGVSPYTCPFYESNICNESLAKKYDLSFLRRYILVTELDADNNPTWNMIPNYSWNQSYMGDNNRTNNTWRMQYPVVIEYNPNSLSSPPPFFK